MFDACCCGGREEAEGVVYPIRPDSAKEPTDHKKMATSKVEEQRIAEEQARKAEEAKEKEMEKMRQARRDEELKKTTEITQDDVSSEHTKINPSKTKQINAADEEWLDDWLKENNFDGIDSKKMDKKKFDYPLHVAVQKNDLSAIQLLLAAGADTSLQNSSKLTPYAMAKKSNKKGCNDVLLATLPADPEPPAKEKKVKEKKPPKDKKDKKSKSNEGNESQETGEAS